MIWDSLAICEYIAELAPEAGLWPEDHAARAVARSVSAEMHTAHKPAISKLRPMNVRRRTTPSDTPAEVKQIFDRHAQVWRECRSGYGKDGPYLFGRFSIADAMCAPTVNRFVSYNVQLGPVEAAYRDAMRAHPLVAEYVALAEAETWVFPPAEVPFAA